MILNCLPNKIQRMKKTKLTEEQCAKIWFFYNWNMTVMEYFNSLEPEGYDWRADFEEPKMTKTDLSSWQMAYNDTLEMVRDLPPSDYKQLDKILKEKLGKGLYEADTKNVKRIEKIVEKGKIRTEEQYYLLREYVERIWGMDGYKEMAVKIEAMLLAFGS